MFPRIFQASCGLAAIMIAVFSLIRGVMLWGGPVTMARTTATAIICLGVACISGAFNGLRRIQP